MKAPRPALKTIASTSRLRTARQTLLLRLKGRTGTASLPFLSATVTAACSTTATVSAWSSGADGCGCFVEIRAGRWKESIQAKDWVGRPVAKALGLDLDSKSG